MGVTVAMGMIKLACAFAGDWVRRVVPRAALLGSIAGVAILLIAFLPSLRIFSDPLVGVVSLVVLLAALVGGVRMPWGLPGALAAVLAGSAIFWGRWALEGTLPGASGLPAAATLGLALPRPTLAWLGALDATLPYLPLAVPFALATVVGGIDNAESALVAGDEYRTRDVLLTEALATIAAGCCGGVVQNTPYIGHPAYKAMGARAGYTFVTGLVIGVGAAVGIVALLVRLLPEAAVAPILVFVGLQITAQAFVASPPRHAAAVAVSFLPAVAALVLIQGNLLLGGVGKSAADLAGEGRLAWGALLVLGNGFILTALVWGSALVAIIDRRLRAAAAVLALAAVATLFGLIHSPLPDGAVFWPWAVSSGAPHTLAAAYGVAASALLLLGRGEA
jgi:AGZA family xanthine/uracil permease-like MFS transporter